MSEKKALIITCVITAIVVVSLHALLWGTPASVLMPTFSVVFGFLMGRHMRARVGR